MTKAIKIDTTYLKSTNARYDMKTNSMLKSYTRVPYRITKVNTSEGEQWIPSQLFQELSDLTKQGTATLTSFTWDAVSKDGEYILIGAQACEVIFMTVKDGRYSYHSRNEHKENKNVNDKSLAQMKRKKIVWIVGSTTGVFNSKEVEDLKDYLKEVEGGVCTEDTQTDSTKILEALEAAPQLEYIKGSFAKGRDRIQSRVSRLEKMGIKIIKVHTIKGSKAERKLPRYWIETDRGFIKRDMDADAPESGINFYAADERPTFTRWLDT